MRSGGEIGRVVKALIQKECQNANVSNVGVCVRQVEQKLAEQTKQLCEVAASQDRVSVPSCQARLASSVWVNPSQLKKNLRGRMAHAVKSLIPHPLRSSNGSAHRGIDTFIQYEARDAKKLEQQPVIAPSVPALGEPSPAAGPPQKMELADCNFVFTHVDEWRFAVTSSEESESQPVKWYYWLQENSDGSYRVYWRKEKVNRPPQPTEEHLDFQLINGHYPENLKLVVEGEKIRLVLN